MFYKLRIPFADNHSVITRKVNDMKIAMIGHKRIPSREGGIEIVVENLSVRMVNAGHTVHSYNRKGHHVSGKEFDKNETINLNEYKGIKIYNIYSPKNKIVNAFLSSYLATFGTLFRQYDCIHYHAEGPCATLWLPHLFGIRTVATIHGLDWQRAKWNGFATMYLKFGEKVAVKYADEIIVLSKNAQKYFMDTYGRETQMIPNGIEKPTVLGNAYIENKWGLKKDDYILFLGRLVPEKGLYYLIDAFLQINTTKKLVIAGGSSHTDGFVSDIKMKTQNDDRIIFTDFVQDESLGELYSNAYIYVLPSDLEGMPIGLLEAMSYGNCCVVSDIPECVEVVEDKAVTFQKGNTADLKNKLEWLIQNKEVVSKYKESASEFICNKYNWDSVTLKTLHLYQKHNKHLKKKSESGEIG